MKLLIGSLMGVIAFVSITSWIIDARKSGKEPHLVYCDTIQAYDTIYTRDFWSNGECGLSLIDSFPKVDDTLRPKRSINPELSIRYIREYLEREGKIHP